MNITAGNTEQARNSLFDYYLHNLAGSGGGGAMDAQALASSYAQGILNMITGDNVNGTVTPGNEMNGRIYNGENGLFQIGPNASMREVSIIAKRPPSKFSIWLTALLRVSFNGGYYFTANTWGENGETRVSHTAKKVNIEWLMPILDVYTPDLNMFNVKTPNYVENLANITQAATDLHAVQEINKSSKFNFHINGTSYYGGSYSADPVSGDTTGFSRARQHFIDSVRSSLGYPPIDSIY